MPTITREERALLAELQRDCRQSVQELAERTGMSASTCWRKIRALEERGVIIGHVAIVAPDKVGVEEVIFAHVRLAKHARGNVEAFVEAVRSRPEVQECHATTGEEDYVLKVLAADMRAYRRFLEEFLMCFPFVEHVRSNVVLHTVKSTAAVPAEIMPSPDSGGR